MTKISKGRTIALGAVIAAGIGYVTGILTAPKSGKETRQDIAGGVSSARAKADKQLKKLHSDLGDLIKQGDEKVKNARSKVSKEYAEALEQAKIARGKAKLLLSAIHHGDADDPHLQAVIDEVKLAKQNLGRFIKK